MAEEKKYRFNSMEERYRRMNGAFLAAAVCLWMMFLMYLVFKLGSNSIARPTAIGNMVLVLIFMVVGFILYFVNKSGRRLKQMIGIAVGIEFLILGVQTNAEFLYFTILCMLALQIPYYDLRTYRRFGIGYSVLYTIVIAVRMVKGIGFQDVDSLIRALCIYLMLIVLYNMGSIAKTFSDDALGFAEDQSSKQKNILDGVLDISETVHQETERSGQLVDGLVSTTETVAQSMQEISSAANTTAQSIEEQNNMTHSIQEAIGETGERSKKMVVIAKDSNESIHTNMLVMEELKQQSEQIAVTNHQVTESMTKLQNKTQEVEEIAGMILKISSQTNLLALNASIESARAGEAGRGFAVVANQIRELAEQTRSSTEEITRIINELNENADEVVTSVGSSVEATESQNKKILSAADSFEKLNANMTELISDITEIDSQILELSDANNNIVENISHLSAATEQVTASAEQVHGLSLQNLTCAEDVKTAMEYIREKADVMKQFI